MSYRATRIRPPQAAFDAGAVTCWHSFLVDPDRIGPCERSEEFYKIARDYIAQRPALEAFLDAQDVLTGTDATVAQRMAAEEVVKLYEQTEANLRMPRVDGLRNLSVRLGAAWERMKNAKCN